MRQSAILVLVLLSTVQGAQRGFDLKKYLRDCPELAFAKDVNEVKTRMLSPQWAGTYCGYSSRPPCDRIGVYVHIYAPDLFSPLKTDVLRGMVEKNAGKALETYGIRVVDVSREVKAGVGPYRCARGPGEKVPILYLSASIVRQPPGPGRGRENVYLLNTRYDLYDWLRHRETDCEIRAPVTGVAIAPSIWYRSSNEEEALIDYMQNHIRRFLQTQYLRAVEREAWTQLSRAGQLPSWLQRPPLEVPSAP